MENTPLNRLRIGDTGKIVGSGTINRRLRDLGLIPGTKIKCVYRSPLGDPAAYLIRGAVVAIRKEDCEGILVQVEETPQCIGCKKCLNIALAGNPNVGKSTVFNCLTGLRQHTGNWAGKTVSNAKGTWHIKRQNSPFREVSLMDIPGCYSLSASSLEEEVARDYICSEDCDGIIVVCDGTCLERNLILVLQILTHTSKVAVCINLMDQVRKRGINIDVERLSEILGVPVITTEAGKKKKMRENLENIIVENWQEDMLQNQNTDGYKPELIEDSAKIVERAGAIAGEVVSEPGLGDRISLRIDKVLTNPLFGFPIMGLMLLGVFWITITGANYPSGALGNLLFSLEEPLYDGLAIIGLPEFVCQMVACGMYRVLAWVVSVMLPPMAIFFPLFTLLEDWGFLPRVAFNLDRCFKCCKACGKQALTMCMGFGCNASGVVGCRIIDSERERIIAMVTNALVPCNGRFPMLICIITMFFAGGDGVGILGALVLASVIVTGIGATMILSKILSMTVLKGVPSSFILELPPFRKPEFGKVIIRSVLDRTLFVLGRAVVVAAPAGMIIWILANIYIGDMSILNMAAEALDPAGRAIGLDGVILMAFILGLPANEIVIPIMMMIYMSQGSLAEVENLDFFRQLLIDNGWTMLTAINVIIFTLMHWPCATTLLSIKRESGSVKWTVLSALAPLTMGIMCCIITTFVGGLLLQN